jgi:hypothetical protein
MMKIKKRGKKGIRNKSGEDVDLVGFSLQVGEVYCGRYCLHMAATHKMVAVCCR